MTKVSVIISCYNLEKYIARSINSCINQTLDDRDYEIIVINDASVDNSKNIIDTFTGIVKIIHQEENSGIAVVSNLGIQQAIGDYIVRVDGDDFINENFLKMLKEVLDHNEDIGFVYCDHILVNERFERHVQINTLEKLLDHGAGIMFRKENLQILGGYNENYKTREDYDLVMRYLKNFDGYHLRLPYYRYFKRDGSLSSKTDQREKEKNIIIEENLK